MKDAAEQNFPRQTREHKSERLGVAISDAPQSAVKPLRVGVVLGSHSTPGVSNVVWGIYSRLTKITPNGKLLGFKNGFRGLLSPTPDAVEITAEDIDLLKNQAGFEMLGRCQTAELTLATPNGLTRAATACKSMQLDSLVIVGSRWALTDVAVLAEHLLESGSTTKVVGVPATMNNDIDTSLIESAIGFDSASKCFSALIGNLLIDAASATKYWMFVTLMGRDNSQLVLESALRAHPNLVLISDTKAASDGTLREIVSEVADVVEARAAESKMFGGVVIPEGLLFSLPQFRQLRTELQKLFASPLDAGKDIMMKHALAQLSPWSTAVLNDLPPVYREQLLESIYARHSSVRLNIEDLLAHLVDEELSARTKKGQFKGAFSALTFYYGFEARSSLPSNFDCTLGYSHGHLAAMLAEGGHTGYVTSMRGLCAPPSSWKPSAVPVTTFLHLQSPTEQQIYAKRVPMVAAESVESTSKALVTLTRALPGWTKTDRYCNPGPLQFGGVLANQYSQTLHEEHSEYLQMLDQAKR